MFFDFFPVDICLPLGYIDAVEYDGVGKLRRVGVSAFIYMALLAKAILQVMKRAMAENSAVRNSRFSFFMFSLLSF